MANRLKMAQVHAIHVLGEQRWWQRRIARELGIHRETVARYLRQAREGPLPDTIGVPARPAKVITGSDALPEAVQAKVITGEETTRSRCEPFREIIQGKLEQGLSAQRIWQDLRDELGFTDGYQSVQRFVRHLQSARPLPFRRMECAPGEEAQVDFGTGAPVVIPKGQIDDTKPATRLSLQPAT